MRVRTTVCLGVGRDYLAIRVLAQIDAGVHQLIEYVYIRSTHIQGIDRTHLFLVLVHVGAALPPLTKSHGRC